MYFRLVLANGGTPYDYIITLDSKDYDGTRFAAEIATKISGITSGSNTVCSYDRHTSKMSVYVTNVDIKFYTDAELKEEGFLTNWWTGSLYDPEDLSSGNELLTNVVPDVVGNTTSPATYYLNLTPVKNIYMKSPNLSCFNTIGPDGSASVIKKVPVNAGPGEMITSFITSSTDFIPCNNLTLKTIEIQLQDINGNEIQLHGSNMSFNILFDVMNSDQ